MEVLFVDVAGEVDERAHRGGDGDCVEGRDVVVLEATRAMDLEALAILRAPAADHIDGGPAVGAQAPQVCRRAMAQDRVRADGQDCRHVPATLGDLAVPDRVDPAVQRMQPPGLQTSRDLMPCEPERDQLAARDDPVLTAREVTDQPIRVFCDELSRTIRYNSS